jgi:hypothetical protein
MPSQLASLPPDRIAQLQNPMALLNPQAAAAMHDSLAALGPQGAQLYDGLTAAIKVALTSSLHDVFVAGALVAVLGVVNALFMREVPIRRSNAPTRPAPASVVETAEAAA